MPTGVAWCPQRDNTSILSRMFIFTFTIVLRVATRVFILKCHSGVVCVNNHMPHCCSVDCVEWCRVDCVEWCSVDCVD